MSSQPTMTCSKCGLVRVVTTSPDATRAWFKKWHYRICDGKPVYQAGVAVGVTQLTGQRSGGGAR